MSCARCGRTLCGHDDHIWLASGWAKEQVTGGSPPPTPVAEAAESSPGSAAEDIS